MLSRHDTVGLRVACNSLKIALSHVQDLQSIVCSGGDALKQSQSPHRTPSAAAMCASPSGQPVLATHLLRMPVEEWQDSGNDKVLKLIKEVFSNLPKFLPPLREVTERANSDKLWTVAFELLMIMHSTLPLSGKRVEVMVDDNDSADHISGLKIRVDSDEDDSHQLSPGVALGWFCNPTQRSEDVAVMLKRLARLHCSAYPESVHSTDAIPFFLPIPLDSASQRSPSHKSPSSHVAPNSTGSSSAEPQVSVDSQKQQILERKAFLLDRNLSRTILPLCPSFVSSIGFDQGESIRLYFVQWHVLMSI
jgi:hypothetical protein